TFMINFSCLSQTTHKSWSRLYPVLLGSVFVLLLSACVIQPIQAPEGVDEPVTEEPADDMTADPLEEAFRDAVVDAADAEPDEIVDTLTALVPENEDLIWDEDGRLLVSTWTSWNGYDDIVGEDMELAVEIWVTAVPQTQIFCQNYAATEDVSRDLRLEQLLGLPPHDGKNRFVEVWVHPDDLFRPSPDPEVDDTTVGLEVPSEDEFESAEDYEQHTEWYNYQTSISYDEQNGYPWTRLGYTYDWGNPESEVGLSEFVVWAGSVIGVEEVYSNDEYCTP
ncbi:MAG: hypothetical protein AAF639_27375, partial [Chloroflexota bacterium]